MFNTTFKLQINVVGKALDKAIRQSLQSAAVLILKAYDHESTDLMKHVTTKTNHYAAFPLFVLNCVLKSSEKLDNVYLQNAYDSYVNGTLSMTSHQFEQFTLCHLFPHPIYRKSYRGHVRTGIGIFLVYLHISKAVTLPPTFVWPIQRQECFRLCDFDLEMCAGSELLSYVRSVETSVEVLQDEALVAVGTDKARLEWFRTFGTKFILASGWNIPEDVSYEDLLMLKSAERSKQTVVSVHRTLIDVLKRKFTHRISVSVDDWHSVLTEVSSKGRLGAVLENVGPRDRASKVYEEVVRLHPAVATPERLASVLALPGLNFNVQENASLWLKLYEIYFEQRRRECYRGPIAAIATFNLYLFYYLPYWFNENPSTLLKFPATPNELVGKIFISRLVRVDEPLPATLMEFFLARRAHSGMGAESFYAVIKQVEVFFGFLVERADELPNCSDFKQPLSRYDYPAIARSLGTDKSPMPRRLFLPFLNFVECVARYINLINSKILSGDLTAKGLFRITKFTSFIDTRVVNELFGIEMPALEINGTLAKLQFVPLPVSSDWYYMKSGKRLRLLRPHALNQILVALYTGLRHNHIQWLDADSFATFVNEDDGDYSLLNVNTDKSKKKAWTPHVNMRVIAVLRSQLEWRNLVADAAFGSLHYYNGNERTAYPKFRPLFSYSAKTGLPHHDSVYDAAWSALILGFQSLIPSFAGVGDTSRVLVKLKPRGVSFNDLNEQEKLSKFENYNGKFCPLATKSNITPHSTRVTVVSHLIAFLPPELIGQYVTGQTRATVFHYVKTEPEELEALRVGQARDLQRRAYEGQIDGFLHGDVLADSSFIKADAVNSRLAKSARVNLPETIARFGCISIDYREGETGGIDVLKEKGIEQAAFNKTEICPYGNHCPQDVIKTLKGLRRCSLCPYAVRSIDHLPALVAREKFASEMLMEVSEKIDSQNADFTDDELDMLEVERQRLGEEYAGWRLCIEALDMQRLRVLAGEDSRTWVVERPEIIEQDLKRIVVPTGVTTYLLSRLQESVQYPGFQSPVIKAQFDMLRRRVLATDVRRMSEAFSAHIPINPAAECAGVLRSLAQAHNLTTCDINELLLSDKHIATMPRIAGDVRLHAEESAHTSTRR